MNWISPLIGIVLGALWFSTMGQMSDGTAQPVEKTELWDDVAPDCCAPGPEPEAGVARRAFDPKSMR